MHPLDSVNRRLAFLTIRQVFFSRLPTLRGNATSHVIGGYNVILDRHDVVSVECVVTSSSTKAEFGSDTRPASVSITDFTGPMWTNRPV